MTITAKIQARPINTRRKHKDVPGFGVHPTKDDFLRFSAQNPHLHCWRIVLVGIAGSKDIWEITDQD